MDPAACKLLVVTSSAAETSSLTAMLHSAEHAAQLAVVLPRLTVVDLPKAVADLSPGISTPLPSAKNKGQWGRLYVCAKKGYAVRYAHEALGGTHAIVTDSEAYVWKPLSIGGLFHEIATRPTVWYSHAPLHMRPMALRGQHAADARAPVETLWCSLHVFRDARGSTRRAMEERIPAHGSSLFEYMLFAYDRAAFRQYWAAVESTWQKPWFDALVAAHEAEPRCTGVGFWLEVSWHLFLYGQHRPRVQFRNVTASIEAALGQPFTAQGSYVHARLELLWRAVSNATLGRFVDFYRTTPLPFFRYEHRARGSCVAMRLVASLPPPAASFQANSAVPNWVFSACASELAALQKRWRAGVATAALPMVRHTTTTRL